MDIKGFLKGLGLSILGTTLVLSLLALAYSLVFNQVTADRNKMKSIFERSTVYEKLPAVYYDSLRTEGNQGGLVPLRDRKIRDIALNLYDEEFTRQEIESALDRTYDWLEGKTAELEITINLDRKKSRLADKLAGYAATKARKLPTCSAAQLRGLNDFNIFSAPCLPPGASPQSVRAAVKKNFERSGSFLENPGFSLADIKNSQSNSGLEAVDQFPDVFRTAKNLPLLLLVFCLILVYLLFKFSKNAYHGRKTLSRLLGVSGVFIFLAPIGFLIFARLLFDRGGARPVNSLALSLIGQFMTEAGKIYYSMGLGLMAAAVTLYVYARRQNRSEKRLGNTKRKT